jgi:hypothetical protein
MGALINLLIFTSLLFPFILIKYKAHLMMTSVYSSQVISFVSNLLLLTFYDPQVNLSIDKKNNNLKSDIILGKLLSYFLILIALILFIYTS